MPPRSRTTKPAASKGIQPKLFKGLNKKRMDASRGNFGVRVVLKDGQTVPVQFLQDPTEFTEFYVHAFQEEGRWVFVPCVGDNCPLCQDDDEKVRRTSYRFLATVYNLEQKKVQLLENSGQLAQAIMYRYQRKPSAFLKRTFEITRFPTTPVSHQFELGEEPTVNTSRMKLLSHEEYLADQLKRYYGDELPEPGSTSMDDEDVEEDEELEDTEEDEEDLDDEDEDLEDEDEDEEDEEEDEDEEEEDDDDEEDEEPPAKKSAPRKSAAAKKTAGRR